jgi:hypothetical protein
LRQIQPEVLLEQRGQPGRDPIQGLEGRSAEVRCRHDVVKRDVPLRGDVGPGGLALSGTQMITAAAAILAVATSAASVLDNRNAALERLWALAGEWQGTAESAGGSPAAARYGWGPGAR